MKSAIRCSIAIGLLSLVMSTMLAPITAFAQGSAGGSIGNDEKSLSGSRDAPRAVESPARRSRAKLESAEPRRAARTGGGGGGGNFDGAWVVNSVGCGSTTRGAVVVTSGRVIGEGVTGTISPNGAVRTVGNFNGIVVNSSGHVSSRSGSGTFQQSNGCGGTWTASKQ
jgi:hypothetical protein